MTAADADRTAECPCAVLKNDRVMAENNFEFWNAQDQRKDLQL